MPDQVEEVKAKTDIVSVIGSFVKLKKAGRNYKGLCPFHAEKTPSFMVSPELQIYKCFGCQESGDVISFLEKYEGMEFYEALKYLADKAGVELKPISPGVAGEKERLFRINLLSRRFYSYILEKHNAGRKALSYLTRKRGLKVNTVNKFGLGFSPNDPYALPNFLIKKKKFTPKELIRVGLVYERGGRLVDRFSERVIFPLYDHRNNVVGFSGRVLPGDKTEMGKYINSPETPLYHKSRILYGLNFSKRDIKKSNEAVIVEGELDLISSWQIGVKNIVAIKGSALTEDQVTLIGRFTPKVVMALDSDFAGDVAARRGISVAQASGLEIKVCNLGDFKDPDEMARKNPSGFKKALNNPIGVWDFLIDMTFSKHDVKSGEGKAKISREIVPTLSSIPDKIVQAHYVEVVAKRLGVPVSAVSEQLLKTPGKKDYEEKVDIYTQVTERSRRELLEERLMTLSLQSEPKMLLEDDIKVLFSVRVYKRILSEFEKYFEGKSSFDASDFSENLPKELFDTFSTMVLKDFEDVLEDEEKLKKEIENVKIEIKMLDHKEKLTKLAVEIKRLEDDGKKSEIVKVQKKFTKLASELSELEESQDRGIIL